MGHQIEDNITLLQGGGTAYKISFLPAKLISAEANEPTITCSKLTIETLEQVWNMFKVNNKDTRHMFLTLNIFHTLF